MDPRTAAAAAAVPASTPTPPSLPTLKPLPKTPRSFQTPTKRINTGTDLATFLTTTAYRDILVFLLQLNRSLCPRRSPQGGPATTYTLTSIPSPTSDRLPAPIKALQNLLSAAEALIELAPPDPGPRRFGNVSFRKWHELLAERAPALLSEHLPSSVVDFPTTPSPSSEPPSAELLSYLLGSFGSSQRLDYGTGHELAFLAFLGSLYKLSFFTDGTEADSSETDRLIVLGVIEPYLRVVRKLILTYTLEPAGSHGVWGLDDHSFLPYIFGSAQLTAPITQGSAEPMPMEGSVRGAPKTGDIVKAAVVDEQRHENMYFAAVGFINDVKKGPFWEHSPILFDVSGVQAGWGKINKASQSSFENFVVHVLTGPQGMLKMFNAEVLQKFPVVQHFTFGSLFSWDQDPDAAPVAPSVHAANQPSYHYPATTAPPPPQGAGTAAPWAAGDATRAPALGSGTAAPWAAGAAGRMPPQGGIPYSRPSPAATARTPPAPGMLPMPAPGSQQGSNGSTDAQVTLTKAPWAK